MRAMGTPAKLLFLLSLVSYGRSESGCQLKQDAAQMLSVDYSVGRALDNKEPSIYVDKIEVKLREEGAKYTDLIKNKASCRDKVIKIEYRKINDSDWKVILITNEGRITSNTKTPYLIPDLNPCDTHEVKVAISNESVNVFMVKPYYSVISDRPITIKNDDHYGKITSAGSKHVNITGFKDTATIKLDKICARKVVIRVFEEDDQVFENKISLKAQGNPEDQPNTVQIEGLKPCTEYEVEMDFFLSLEHTEADYHGETILFTTTPNTENLEKYTSYIEDNKTLTWNFKDFVTQECSDPVDEGDTTFTIKVDNTPELVEEKGSKDLRNSEGCEVNVQLHMKYTKKPWKEPWEKSVFEKQVTGAKKLEDSLEEDNGALVLTEDVCKQGQGELKVRWAPLRESKNLGRMAPGEEAVNFPGLRGKPEVSELPLPWTGCSDRTLQVIREEEGEGRIVTSTTVQHPGWEKVRPSLEVVTQNGTEVTFKVPMEGCEEKDLEIEVLCNIKESRFINMSGKGEENLITGEDLDQEGSMSNETLPEAMAYDYSGPEVEPTDIFTIDDPLTLDNLKPGTEYECKARVTGEVIESPWSEKVLIHQVPSYTETEPNLDSGSDNDPDTTNFFVPNPETSKNPEIDEDSNPEANDPKTAVQPDPELTTSTSSPTTTIIIVILVILMIILIILAVFFCRKKKEYTVEQMPEDPVKKEEEVVLKEVSKVSPMAPIDETPEIVIDPATPKPNEGEDVVEKGPEVGGDKTTTAEISSPPTVSPLSADTTDPGTTPKTDKAESGQAPKTENQEVSSNAPPKSDNTDTNSDPKGES